MQPQQLTGHTALCLVSLIGYFIYSASYSIVYRVKAAGASPPVPVLEMWMVLTQLSSSLLTCGACAVWSIQSAEAQTGLFLHVALSVSVGSAACMQDSAQCSLFFPAAAWPPLAAAGAIAWAWVLYIASLGCQSVPISLGFGQPPLLLALVTPALASTLAKTCGGACLLSSAPLACDGLPIHITCVVLAALLWHAGPMPQVVATVVLIVDAFLALAPSNAWLVAALSLNAFLTQNVFLSRILFGTGRKQQLHMR
jgi:hypothetical protein